MPVVGHGRENREFVECRGEDFTALQCPWQATGVRTVDALGAEPRLPGCNARGKSRA